jgi:hypothetical protein
MLTPRKRERLCPASKPSTDSPTRLPGKARTRGLPRPAPSLVLIVQVCSRVDQVLNNVATPCPSSHHKRGASVLAASANAANVSQGSMHGEGTTTHYEQQQHVLKASSHGQNKKSTLPGGCAGPQKTDQQRQLLQNTMSP